MTGRVESAALPVLLAVAGTWIGAGVVLEQAGRVVQWFGRELDRATCGWRV